MKQGRLSLIVLRFTKNIYEKIYSDKDDVSLFWKTKDLYYIKSEHNYSSMEIRKGRFYFFF